MENVNLNQLYTVCNLYLECEFPYFEELREAFHVLNICGCRIEELFQIDRWTYVNGDTVTLQPQKNNLPRTIILNEHTQNFKNCIINQTKPFLGRTSYQLQYLFRKLNPYRPIYSGGREITLYVYRYKHIWEMQANGFTIEEIRLEMGHRTQTPILLYLNASLSSTYPIIVADNFEFEGVSYPTITIGNFRIITTSIKWNDGNSGIYINPVNPNFSDLFGCLYSWAAKERFKSLLTDGWKIPTDIEITEILNQFGGLINTSQKFRDPSIDYWSNIMGTNESGLSFRGSGYHYNSSFSGYRTFFYLHLDNVKSATTYNVLSVSNNAGNVSVNLSASKSAFRSSIRVIKSL